MNRKKLYFLLIPTTIVLVLSYLGYIIVYLVAKSRAIQRGASPEMINLWGSIPGFGWFLLYSLVALLIGLLIGFFIYKLRNKK